MKFRNMARSSYYALAECALNFSHSQWKEDLAILPTLLAIAGSRRGTFVEIGALDGITLSNTFMLEHCFAWNGLLIEGSPMNFKVLKQSGRKSAMRHSAICDANVESVNMSIAEKEHLSPTGAQSDRMSSKTKYWINKQNLGLKSVQVPCQPLPVLMDNSHVLGRTVDFLSLDVEGAEDLVLIYGRPASRFKVILIEVDGRNRERDETVVNELRVANMTRSKHVRVLKNQIWLAPGVVEYPVRGITTTRLIPSRDALAEALRSALSSAKY
jgi:FkbM family methyltransferase